MKNSDVVTKLFGCYKGLRNPAFKIEKSQCDSAVEIL